MLRLPRQLYDEIIAHCQREYPKEACGLLAGSSESVGGGLIGQVYPMRNVEDSPIGYSMDPKEQLVTEKQMRQRAQRLIGIYHSHTATEAYPSPVDVRLAISPEISYVLVSLKDRGGPQLKSYRIDGQTITAEDVRLESVPPGA